MADIAKCVGTGCPLKETCYRFTAPSNEYRQSWLVEVPIKIIKSVGREPYSYDCDFYGKNEK